MPYAHPRTSNGVKVPLGIGANWLQLAQAFVDSSALIPSVLAAPLTPTFSRAHHHRAINTFQM
jgi:hypothetical protein